MDKGKIFLILCIVLLLSLQACTLPEKASSTPELPTAAPETPTASTLPATEEPGVQHEVFPVSAPNVQPYPDVTSEGTAPERRAPYGDSYSINRLERPFLQDMTYVSDLDISALSIAQDDLWYYVSIGLVGKNPNNPLGINYSVELDTNLDSFGDFLIVASPPYTEEWTALNVQVYQDTNNDTAGLSASKSDAPFAGDGFDALIHSPVDDLWLDPDLAWVRMGEGEYATIQFAFKKTWAGSRFLYSVMADGGPRNPSILDYVDHWTLPEAGSSVRDTGYYPLGQLFAVDNTCYQAFGFNPTGTEPKICPVIVQPEIIEVVPETPGVDACTAMGQPNPGNCPYGWSDYPFCICTPG